MDTECSVLTTQLVTSMGFFWQLPVLSSCFLGKVVGRPLFEFGLKILMTSGWLSMGSCLLKQAHFLVQCCLPPPPEVSYLALRIRSFSSALFGAHSQGKER